MKKVVLIAALATLSIGVAHAAAKAKVFIVNYENQADHKVYFVDYENQQKNQQIISPGELVDYENQADVKVFIVNYENQASIKIMRKNFPK